jgi:K+-transporting ATPase KdpF subunit
VRPLCGPDGPHLTEVAVAETVIIGVIVLGLLVYLGYALIRPERL